MKFSFIFQILVARRWYDDTIEFVNSEVEFDEYSIEKFQQNQIQLMADIDANLKLFLNSRWQNAKKVRLPTVFNFDERVQVRWKLLFSL